MDRHMMRSSLMLVCEEHLIIIKMCTIKFKILAKKSECVMKYTNKKISTSISKKLTVLQMLLYVSSNWK
jgi:hypothetical protein